MKNIKDTFIFKMQDKATDLLKHMLIYDPTVDDVDMTAIDEQISVIHRRYKYPAKNIILNDLGVTIKPVYNLDRIRIISSLPAYLMVNPRPANDRDQVIAIVNLTNHAVRSKTDNTLNLDPKQLFALLQAGEILLTCRARWSAICMHQEINKLGALIYSRMFVKILDRMFAVNYNPIVADKLKYIAAKFYMLNLLERSESDTVNNIAYSTCTNGTTRHTIDEFNAEFPTVAYQRLDNFIMQIQVHFTTLGSLTVRTFLDTSFKMYHPAIMFAWEYFPMFVHVVASVVIGAHLVNDGTLETVIGKEADKFYNDFVSMMRQ